MRYASSILRWGGAPVLALMVLAGMAGCRSQQEKALEEAKKQAATSGQPRQVVSVDKDGTTTTTVVQPPAQGQTQPTVTTTTAPPPAGQPKPAPMAPKVSPVVYQSDPAQQLAEDLDQPQAQKPAAGQPAGQPQYAAAPQQPIAGGAPQAAQAPAPVTIPAGTSLAIRVDQSISVKTAHAGDRFTGEVVSPVADGYGNLIVPKGTRVGGLVDAAHKRGHFKGASVLELRLTSMNLGGQEMPIETKDFAESKKGKGKRTAAMIGGGSGLGMLIGGVATGGAGLLWGGLAGAGAGTAAAGLTGNRDLVIPAETVVHFKLSQDIVVQK
jgi:hypothetical protein